MRRRADRRKVLPSGIPDVMFENPESVDALDFKVRQHCNEMNSSNRIYKHYVDYCSRCSD